MHLNNSEGHQETRDHARTRHRLPDIVEDLCHHTPQPREKHQMALHHCKGKNKKINRIKRLWEKTT